MVTAPGQAYADSQTQKQKEIALFDQTALDSFYTAREGRPFWLEGSRLNEKGRVLLKVLMDSWQDGLNPQAYHVDAISRLSGVGEDETLYQEILLSDAYIRYIRDMSGMRVDAKALGLRPGDWKQPVSAREALFFLSDDDMDVAAFLASFAPQGETYRRMKAELIHLMEEENDTDAYEKPIRFKGVLRPGTGDEAVAQIRARLGVAPENEDLSGMYDNFLAQAVMRFQQENGLKADGVVGPDTLRLMNQGRRDKIEQLIVNMERLRWVEEKKPRRFVVVNVPSQTLWAIADGEVQFEMPVVVGRSGRETPSFRTDIVGVRFNPDWTVPPTIRRKDIWPQLKADPHYLTGKGMEVYDGYGRDAQTLDPSAIDWNAITAEDLRQLRFVQSPGEHNPLGWIKILMPNAYDVYLHDTNHPEMFAEDDRMLSSGCVRMKYPEKMAKFVMQGQRGWDDAEMLVFLKKQETVDIRIDEKIPVYFVYYTAWVGPQGGMVYGRDIYGEDAELLKNLQILDGIDPSIYHSQIAAAVAE